MIQKSTTGDASLTGAPSDPDMPQVLCIGETMAMVTTTNAAPIAAAETFTVSPGGAESNVAQYLAELGVATAWISTLGADPLGDRIEAAIAGAGVDTRWVRRNPDANTGVYVKEPRGKVYYYRKGSAASCMGPELVDSWPISNARWIHLSGITPALSRSCHDLMLAVIAAAEDAGAGVSFDVNYRAALWPKPQAAVAIQSLGNRADIVFVGRDEAETLWGTMTAEAVAGIFPEVGSVVVKDGDVEAVEFNRTGSGEVVTRLPARQVDVVESVGAGDAFAAGYLAALFRGDSAEERLALGHSFAAWVLGSPLDYRPGHGLNVRLAETR